MATNVRRADPLANGTKALAEPTRRDDKMIMVKQSKDALLTLVMRDFFDEMDPL
jgi:hypothetical protein